MENDLKQGNVQELYEDVEMLAAGEGNNREIQPRNNRRITFFDKNDVKTHGIESIERLRARQENQTNGHYERIKKKATRYFYVGDMQPSGIPGAVVISPKEAMGPHYRIEE